MDDEYVGLLPKEKTLPCIGLLDEDGEHLGCGNYGRWHVWYRGFSSPTTPPFPPANIAYNTLCDDCAAHELKHGRVGYQVACVKPIDNRYLPNSDRAKRAPA